MNIMKQQIDEIFTDLQRLKETGIWFNGYELEGEYKKWYKNGQLFIHCSYENGKIIKDYLE